MAPVNVVDVLLSGFFVTLGVTQFIEPSWRERPKKLGAAAGKALAGMGFICTGLSVLALGRDASYIFLAPACLAYLWAMFSTSDVKAAELLPTFFGRHRG